MAVRTSNRMRTGSPVVTDFEFDDSILSTDILKIKIFEDYTTDWADFILMNRKNLSEGTCASI